MRRRPTRCALYWDGGCRRAQVLEGGGAYSASLLALSATRPAHNALYPTCIPGDQVAEYKAQFSVYDGDGSGEISHEELKLVR